MGDLNGLIRDPEFINLPLEQQRQALVSATGDKEFSGLSDLDTQKFLNVARSKEPTQFEQERTKGVIAAFGRLRPEAEHDFEALPGSFEGKPENVGDYIPNTVGNVGKGVANVAKGNVSKGTHQIISGGANALLPAAPLVAAAAPVAAGVTGAAGYAGGKVLRKGAEALGGTEDQAQLAEDIGNIAAGYGAGKYGPAALEALTGKLGATSGTASDAVLPAVTKAKVAAQTIADSDAVGLAHPTTAIRAQKAASALSKVEAMLRARQAARASQNAPDVIPEEGGGPVTTPSDVPLEQIPEDVPPQIANLYKLRRGWQDNFEDAQIRQAMSDDLYQHGVSAGREVRAQQLAERQAAGLDVPKWQRTANVQAQQIMDEAQQRAQAVIEQARQKGERGVFASVPKYQAAENAAAEIANTPQAPSTAERLSATQNLEELLRQSIARAKAAKGKK